MKFHVQIPYSNKNVQKGSRESMKCHLRIKEDYGCVPSDRAHAELQV
jgi:hypothetical protein